jgi:hypothetical protein
MVIGTVSNEVMYKKSRHKDHEDARDFQVFSVVFALKNDYQRVFL